MKTLAFKLLCLLPIALFLGSTSYFVDPSGFFNGWIFHDKNATTSRSTTGGRGEQRGAEILLKGLNLGNPAGDDRLRIKYYVQQLKQTKRAILFGSSRSFLLGADDLFVHPTDLFFNSSVAGARIEDFVAFSGLYRENGMEEKASLFIFELPPWLLNPNNPASYWSALASEYQSMMGVLHPEKKMNVSEAMEYDGACFFDLFSTSYYQMSIRHFFMKNLERVDYPTNKKLEFEDLILAVDGSSSSGIFVRARSVQEARSYAVTRFEHQRDPSLTSFVRLGDQQKTDFECLISYFLDKKKKIVFLLTPFHPLYYSEIPHSNDMKPILDAEVYFRAFAASHQIPVIGSYDPAKCSCDDSDFFDQHHLRKGAFRKIFKDRKLVLPDSN